MIEYTIKIKADSQTLTEKEITYDSLLLSHENEQLKSKIEEIVCDFKENILQGRDEVIDVILTAKMIW